MWYFIYFTVFEIYCRQTMEIIDFSVGIFSILYVDVRIIICGLHLILFLCLCFVSLEIAVSYNPPTTPFLTWCGFDCLFYIFKGFVSIFSSTSFVAIGFWKYNIFCANFMFMLCIVQTTHFYTIIVKTNRVERFPFFDVLIILRKSHPFLVRAQ